MKELKYLANTEDDKMNNRKIRERSKRLRNAYVSDFESSLHAEPMLFNA